MSAPVLGTYNNKNVGTGKLVTIAGLTLTGADAGNYLLASGSVSAAIGVITPATVTAGLTGTVSKVYDGNTNAALGAGNLVLDGVLGADLVTLSNPLLGAYDTKNVGAGKLVTINGLGLLGADAGNYVLASTAASAAIGAITPASVSVTLTVGAGGSVTKTYDATNSATVTGANLTVTGLVAGDAVALATPLAATYDNKNVGTGKLITISGLALTGADAKNYTLAVTTSSAAIGTITPATLTAGLTGSVSKVYDGTRNATLTSGNYALAGVLGADLVTLNQPAAGLFNDRNVGTNKLVTVSGLALLGADAGNYVLASSSASGAIGTITPAVIGANLNATLTGVVNKTYDGTTVATLAARNYRLTGLIAGDLVGLNNPTTGVYDTKDVGTNKLVTVSGLALTGANAGNYTLSETTISGNVGEIDAATLSAALLGPVAKTYDGTRTATLAAGNLQLTGVIAGETVTVSATAATFDTKNAGTGKLVTVTGLTLGGADAGNYLLATGSTSGVVGQIGALTISAALTGPITKTYNGTTAAPIPAGSIALAGLVAGDSVSLGPVTGVFGDKNVGTNKLVTVNGLVLTGLDRGNYVLAEGSTSAAVGQITPATVGVTLTGPVAKTYDTTTTANLTAGNYVVTGLIGGDDVVLNNPTLGTFNNQNAGTGKLVTVGGLALLGEDAGNYQLTSPTAAAAVGVITPASVSVTLTGTVTKTYNGNTTAALGSGNYLLTGVLGEDAVSVLNTLGTFESKGVGTGKIVSVTGLLLGGAQGGNYVVTPASVSGAIGSISPATVTIGPGGVTKSYDGTTAAPGAGGYILSGIFGNDRLSVTAATGSYANPNVAANQGTGLVTLSTVTLGGADAGNYVFESAALGTPRAIGRISPAGLEVKANDRSKTLGQTVVWTGTEFTVTGLQNGETATLASIASAGAAANAEPEDGLTFPIVIANLRGGTFEASNYQIRYVEGALRVTGFEPPAPEAPGGGEPSQRVAVNVMAEAVLPRMIRVLSANYTFEAAFRDDAPASWRNFLPERQANFSEARLIGIDLDERNYREALARWGWTGAILPAIDQQYIAPTISL